MEVRASALLAAVAFALVGCGGKSAPQLPPALAVEIGHVAQRDFSTSIDLDGQVAPVLESTLSTPESGTVTVVNVNEGDRVTRGQLLAQLDTSQLQAQLAAAQASASQAEAHLNGSTLQAPISSQGYNSTYAGAQQNLLAAQNRVQTAQAALRNAQLVDASNQSLLKQGFVAQTTAVQSHAQLVSAQQELNNARQALPAAQAALSSARSSTGLTQVDRATIASNRAALAQAQADVKLLDTQIAQSSLYSPFEGVVTQRLLDPGAYAGPNQPIVRVSQIDTVYVNIDVPDGDLDYVNAGSPVTFTTPSVPDRTFSGNIFTVNATPTSGTLSYRARIREHNPGDVLRGGMLVTVRIVKENRPNAFVVPRTAIFQTDHSTLVYTVVDGKAKAVPVTVGLQTETLSQIAGSNVRQGMAVITTRPDALQDGSRVQIADNESGMPETK